MCNRMYLFQKRLIPLSVGVFGDSRCNDIFDVKNSEDALLDYIYSVDPVTKLPKGDLSVYLGDKSNPEIKAFIQSQLLVENAPNVSSLPTDITNQFKNIKDEDVAFFSRSDGESREEYADRIRLFFKKEQDVIKQKRKLDEIKRLVYGHSKDN